MILVDVTKLMDWNNPDDELLPITKCACGAVFDVWDFQISIYADWAKKCPKCGRKFIFCSMIKIYEVKDEDWNALVR